MLKAIAPLPKHDIDRYVIVLRIRPSGVPTGWLSGPNGRPRCWRTWVVFLFWLQFLSCRFAPDLVEVSASPNVWAHRPARRISLPVLNTLAGGPWAIQEIMFFTHPKPDSAIAACARLATTRDDPRKCSQGSWPPTASRRRDRSHQNMGRSGRVAVPALTAEARRALPDRWVRAVGKVLPRCDIAYSRSPCSSRAPLPRLPPRIRLAHLEVPGH